MAEMGYFFNSVSINGELDRAYDAADHAAYFAQLIRNGIFYFSSDVLQVVSSTGMNVSVNTGGANINGYFYQNSTAKQITVSTASGTMDRIDRVVIRLDLVGRMISAEYKIGTPLANPAPPALTRTNDVYELSLAQILVVRGAATITQANITDERLNDDVCGIVVGLIDQIDMSALYVQQNAQFQLFMTDIIEQLGDEAAGNLQNQINTLESMIGFEGETTGTAPNYEMNIDGFTLLDGTEVRAKIHAQTVSQAVSFNINGIGAIQLVDGFGDAVLNLQAGTWLLMIYNGVSFQAVGLSSQFVVYS